jgi:hypothetical protein
MILPMPCHPSALCRALNHEWAELISDAAPVPAHWRCTRPALTGCPLLRDILPSVGARPDPVLHALLSLCVDGELLAGRVVLQAMLGKLVRMAARDLNAGLDDYLSAMWLQIRTYPLADRPARIAANLALDTLKDVRRQTRVAPGIDVTPYPPSAFVDALFAHPGPDDDGDPARRVIQTAAQLGLINSDTEAVLISVYADGLTGACAAARHGKSPGAIRVQCHKAVRTLARHAQVLAETA